ncbi:hypothetical protein SAY87_024223 [Trapa incisa]|uniref:Plant bHLH transcription factor ACT-like domain-containing protein n=1 Tax=Trapa incisa TaxID=236973 RepID=A0AAN7JFL5_9MYRT|nr:hypothetical protein SAY87_024223 [Trapa incisa]
MARGMHKRATLRRKLHILRSRSASSPDRESSVVSVALFLYIHKLKMKLAGLARDCCTLYATNKRLLAYSRLHKNEVRVEKVVSDACQSYIIRVTCERRRGRLVSILEALEKMGLNLMQARISCTPLFAMEAVAVAAIHAQPLEERDVREALLKAIEQQ